MSQHSFSWSVHQRLSEPIKKTVLGSTEHTLGRSRNVQLLKQQGPDHELLVYDGDRKRDRDRKMRAYVQGETEEWEQQKMLGTRTIREMHENKPLATKLVHGKLKTISSKEASRMKMKKVPIRQSLN